MSGLMHPCNGLTGLGVESERARGDDQDAVSLVISRFLTFLLLSLFPSASRVPFLEPVPRYLQVQTGPPSNLPAD